VIRTTINPAAVTFIAFFMVATLQYSVLTIREWDLSAIPDVTVLYLTLFPSSLNSLKADDFKYRLLENECSKTNALKSIRGPPLLRLISECVFK
jgi:hypothetical protein